MPNEEVPVQQIAAPSDPGMPDFEREQIRVERLKVWLTAGSVIAAVAAAILAYFSAQWVQSQQTAEAFQLKAAGGHMPNEEVPIQPIAAPISPGMTEFEREQIRVERLKAWLTAGSVIAAVAAAILAYLSAQRVQNKQAAEAFQLKAAEIVMASKTPWEAQGKARALATFFPNKVPPSMADDTFDPAKHGWGRESHRELLTLLLTGPPTSREHRDVVLRTWKAFFPGDTWVNDITTLP